MTALRHSSDTSIYLKQHIIQIYSGITCGRVLNGECYTQRLHKLIFLYLSTGCFVEFSLLSSGLKTYKTTNFSPRCTLPVLMKARISSIASWPISWCSRSIVFLPCRAAQRDARFRCSRTIRRLSTPPACTFGSNNCNKIKLLRCFYVKLLCHETAQTRPGEHCLFD